MECPVTLLVALVIWRITVFTRCLHSNVFMPFREPLQAEEDSGVCSSRSFQQLLNRQFHWHHFKMHYLSPGPVFVNASLSLEVGFFHCASLNSEVWPTIDSSLPAANGCLVPHLKCSAASGKTLVLYSMVIWHCHAPCTTWINNE